MTNLLRKLISLILSEGDDDRIKRSASPGSWRENRDEAFEEEVEELMGAPEFKSVDTFANFKLDNDEYSFTAVELQALVRSIESKRLGHNVNAVSPDAVTHVKTELTSDFGFEFVPRKPTKFARGSMSSSHGSHPMAGSGGGGSGFGSDFGGGTFTAFGGGPGAVGGGGSWSVDDDKNLKMGAGRKKQ